MQVTVKVSRADPKEPRDRDFTIGPLEENLAVGIALGIMQAVLRGDYHEVGDEWDINCESEELIR